jgi:hypothetical protein
MIKPITRKEYNDLVKWLKDVSRLASTHDPDHGHRLDILERQVERLGAPQYRTLYKGKQKPQPRKK